VIFVLILTIMTALLTRPGRAAAIKSDRLLHLVPVLDAVRSVALIAIPVLAVLAIADYRSSGAKTLASDGRTVSTASASRARVPPSNGRQSGALANTGADVTTTTEAPTPATVCRNSTDPACGPFRWDPPPAPNSPTEVSISYSPSAPRIGEAVTITVHARDDDALVADVTMTFGDENVFTIPPALIISCDIEPPAGPWTPPAPTPDELVKTFTHTYDEPGDLTITAYAASPEILNPTCPPHPYASQATASSPIHVSEA
jgi:hypothetical protein